MSKIFHHLLPHLKILGYMLSYSLLITISPHILAETPDEIIDDLNKEKISLIKQESSLKNQILDLDKTFNNSINEIDNEIQRTKKGFRDEKIDSSIRDLESSSQKFTNLVKKKKIKIKDLGLQISLLDRAISAETKMRTIHELNIIGGMSSSEELTSHPMVSMLRLIESQTKSDRIKLYEWCKTTMLCYPTRWDKSCLFEDYYVSKQYKRYMMEKADYKCTQDVAQQMWREDDLQRLPPVIDQLKKEVASIDLEIKDLNYQTAFNYTNIEKLNKEKNKKLTKLISPLINRQDKLKQEYKQRKSEIENVLSSLRSQLVKIDNQKRVQKNKLAKIESIKSKIKESLVFALLIVFIIYILHRYEKYREQRFIYLLNRGSKSGVSIMRLFRGKKKREVEFDEFSKLHKNHVTELLDKAINSILDKNNTEILDLQGQLDAVKIKENEMKRDIEKENLERSKDLDKLIQEKNNEIDVLQKRIQHEKEIFKKLQTKHKYIGEWVKNR